MRRSRISMRMILTPHGFVASSMIAISVSLISARFERTSSRSSEPITERKLVVVKLTMASSSDWTW